jgi:hypothetical protein
MEKGERRMIGGFLNMEGRSEKEIIRLGSRHFNNPHIWNKCDRRRNVRIDFRERDPGGKAAGSPGTVTRASDEPSGQGGTG